jgi:mannose-6-phosphate isomerase-like protein (cupin superfamily)
MPDINDENQTIKDMSQSQMKIEKISLDEIIKLKENNWVIGTPPAVTTSSPGFSNSLQISYYNRPKDPKEEKYHYHTDNIEECYIVLQGKIRLKINGKTNYELEENEAIRVPPYQRHKIINFSKDVSYLTIRAPISDDSTTVECTDK